MTSAAGAGAQGRLADSAGRLLGLLDGTLAAVGGVLLAALLAVACAGAALRYVFGAGLLGADELAIWLFTALVFLGLPGLGASGASMRLDLLAGRLGARGRAGAAAAADAVGVHASIVLLSGGAQVVALVGGTSTTLGLPEWVRFAAVPVGAGLALAAVPLRAAAAGRPLAGAASLAGGAALWAVSHAGILAALPTPSLAAGGAALAWLAVGAPLPLAVVSALSLAVPLGALLPEAAIAQNAAAGVGRHLLLAIPFFLLASVLMHHGGLADRLVRLASALVGHRRGGLAQTTLLTSVLFAGVSGSSVADAAFGAKVLAPGLREAGYAPARAAAIVAATAVLPNVIPPSVALLILAHAAGLSVGALFSGGLVAGLVLAAALAAALHLGGGSERGVRAAPDRAERAAAMRGAFPVVGLALVVLLGIRLGVVTPTEAAAAAALYALAAAAGLRGPRGIAAAFARSAGEASAVGLLVGTAAPLVFLLAVDGVPAAVSGLLSGLGPFGVLVASNLVLLAAGCVLDIGAAILLFAPILLPAATAAGVDPVAAGVLLVVNLMIGGLTPPVGVLVYVAASLTGQKAGAVFRACLPFVAALLAALLLMGAVVGALAR